MKNNTTIPQSQMLATILPIESADMKWFIPADNEGEFVEEVTIIKYKYEYNSFEKVTDWEDTPYVPCWSLAALLNVLPRPSVYFSNNKWYCECWNENGYIGQTIKNNPVDACYDMIIKLNKEKLLNK